LVEYNISGAGCEQVNNYSTIRGSIPQNFTFNGATVKDILVGTVVQQTANEAAGDQVRNGIPIQTSPPGNIYAEDGTLSRLRRNTETGELYDPGQ
jgi:hypothetical protein